LRGPFLTCSRNLGLVLESSYADFLVAQHCELSAVGQLGERHYAIAFPKGSIYKDQISHQVERKVFGLQSLPTYYVAGYIFEPNLDR
jgi:hypothetical protein